MVWCLCPIWSLVFSSNHSVSLLLPSLKLPILLILLNISFPACVFLIWGLRWPHSSWAALKITLEGVVTAHTQYFLPLFLLPLCLPVHMLLVTFCGITRACTWLLPNPCFLCLFILVSGKSMLCSFFDWPHAIWNNSRFQVNGCFAL